MSQIPASWFTSRFNEPSVTGASRTYLPLSLALGYYVARRSFEFHVAGEHQRQSIQNNTNAPSLNSGLRLRASSLSPERTSTAGHSRKVSIIHAANPLGRRKAQATSIWKLISRCKSQTARTTHTPPVKCPSDLSSSETLASRLFFN